MKHANETREILCNFITEEKRLALRKLDFLFYIQTYFSEYDYETISSFRVAVTALSTPTLLHYTQVKPRHATGDGDGGTLLIYAKHRLPSWLRY